MMFGAFELVLLLVIVLIIVGPRRIANLGRSLGRSVRDFKLEFNKDRKAVGGQRSDAGKDADSDSESR